MENVKEYEDIFLNSLLIGSRNGCYKVVKEFRKSNLSIIVLYEDIFKNSLYRIGKMWESNKISVAIEHMSTSIVEGLMNELLPEIISLERKNKTIIVSCVENEEHQVGGKMVADIFEKNSWDAKYLGANTPMVELVRFCELEKPDLVCLSLSVYENVQFLLKEITEIRKVTNVPILIGGQALRNIGIGLCKTLENVLYFEKLKDVENYIRLYS